MRNTSNNRKGGLEMINCENFNENICAYIDNELNIEERLSFEEHIKICRECKRELEEMARVVSLCNSLPQQELPAEFKAELREKLVAVAGRQERQGTGAGKVAGRKGPKGFLFFRTFAAVAAGLLLVFLAGIYFRYGMLSNTKTGSSASNTALAMDRPAEAMNGVAADAAVGAASAAAEPEMAGGAGTQAKTFGIQAVAPAASAEIDRSARIQNRDAAAAEKASGSEAINSKTSTITVVSGNPASQMEKIKLLAEQNSGEIIENTVEIRFSESFAKTGQTDGNQAAAIQESGPQILAEKPAEQAAPQTGGIQSKTTASSSVQAADAGISGSQQYGGQGNTTSANTTGPARTLLQFIIPDTQYDKFVAKLYVEFGGANVQPGALVTQDATAALNSSIAESAELDNKIQELQKDSSKNSAEIAELKEKKETADKRIDELRLGNDFVIVTIVISGK